jgi:hypothetical protein
MKKRIAGILGLIVLIGSLAQAGPTVSTVIVKPSPSPFTMSKTACGERGC